IVATASNQWFIAHYTVEKQEASYGFFDGSFRFENETGVIVTPCSPLTYNSDSDASKKGYYNPPCDTWKSGQAMLVLSNIVGIAGIGAMLMIVFGGQFDDPRWYFFAGFAASFGIALLQMITMILAVKIENNSSIYQVAIPNVTSGPGFAYSGLAMSFACLVAVGLPIVFRML
ncbi:hypothetical protein HDU76_012061, partial [Blyttiomyces sp. JEL0837]